MQKYLLCAAFAALLVAPAAAQSFGGTYTVAGTNFDDSPYTGEAEITLTSETTCVIKWATNGTTSEGICMRNADAFSAAYVLQDEIGLVTYKVMEDGTLHGLWTLAGKEGNGTEVLTPKKPTAIAIQRRQPTGSAKNTAAPIVTASGSACMTAEILASGNCASATRKKIVAPSSPMARSSTTRWKMCRHAESASWCHATRVISTVAKQPRTNMICPMLTSEEAIFTSESLRVNPAIDTAMKTAPRRFGERGKGKSDRRCCPCLYHRKP